MGIFFIEHGRNITVDEAQEIINQQKKITSLMRPELNTITVPHGIAVKNYYTGDMNAFVFDKKRMQDILKNPEVDNLMIILGAHPKNDEDFKEGDPTVIVLGCKDFMENQSEVTFRITNGTQISEHPPHQVLINLKNAPGKDDTLTLLK